MRLTLRTLLAYLDDILPPAETKEIGEKIAATPTAAQLVDRIRDVMRRRRLTAPEPDGSGGGIEPNLVAEYLDNSLAPERVADVERVCLESDVNLAEVAACHQVLTLVLGEPVEISSRLRERMYALGPHGTQLDVPDGVAPSKRVREADAREQLAAIKAAQNPPAKPQPKPLESRLPDYLKRKPLWKRLLPWAAVAAVIALWLGLLYGDPELFGTSAEPEGGRVVADADPADAPRRQQRRAQQPREERPERAAPTGASVAVSELPDLPLDPEPPSDERPLLDESRTASMQASRQATTTSDPEAPEPAGPLPSPEVAAAAAAESETTTDATAEAAGPPLVKLGSVNGLLLRFDSDANIWWPMTANEMPPVGEPLAIPEPFDAQLSIGTIGLDVTALGGTRFRAIGGTDAAPSGIDIAQGRLRMAVAVPDPSQISKAMFALQLGPGLWRVEPLTAETTFGIEALPLQPTGMNQDLSERTPQGVIYVTSGAVRVADGSNRVEVASAGNRLILTPGESGGIGTPAAAAAPMEVDPIDTEEPADAALDAEAESAVAAGAVDARPEPASAEAVPADATPVNPSATPEAAAAGLPGFPDWLVAREPTTAARRAMIAFEKEFLLEAPVAQSLLPAVGSPYFFVAEPAAKALSLIEDVDGMVKALRDTEHHEAVIAAVEGLRNWLGRSPAHGEPLQAKLEEVFGRDLAAILYELLWGYGPDDARNREIAERLVNWLDHPEPVVRELSFYHVERLAGRTMYYRPLQSASQRAGAVNRWREFVNRNGGLVTGP